VTSSRNTTHSTKSIGTPERARKSSSSLVLVSNNYEGDSSLYWQTGVISGKRQIIPREANLVISEQSSNADFTVPILFIRLFPEGFTIWDR